jgi:hypothetical protein
LSFSGFEEELPLMSLYERQTRQARYFTLSSEIAHLDTAQLRSLFDATETRRGWGENHVLTIHGSQVFVKRLPLTNLEHDNSFSTKNLYDLPTYYNYGVGSAGFGAFRELLTHIKTTNWVLKGAIANFPTLYHYRIIPAVGEQPAVDRERLREYVEYWNNNENIGRRMLDRLTIKHELVLFLEYIPYAIEPWLLDHPGKLNQVLEDIRTAITFLRNHGIIHFDANLDNIISDGKRAYLTDFGLVLDKHFTLTKEELRFFKRNTYYDYGQILGSIDFLLHHTYTSLPDDERPRILRKYGIAENLHPVKQTSLLLNHIEKVLADDIQMDTTYAATLVKYHRITQLFLDFYVSMRESNTKDTKFPNRKLKRLLDETGFLTDSL